MSQGLHVTFSLEPRVDAKHLHATGETRWVNVEYIRIHVPGDKTNVPHRPVTDEDKARFVKQYEAWKRGQEVHDGQPLKEWAPISPAEVNTLAQANVHTVEQLAAVSDENASRIGPILALRDKARKHLESARLAAPLERLTRQLAEKEQAEAALLERLARLEAALAQKEQAEAEEPAPKRKRRKAGEAEEPTEDVKTEG